jgi:hypothetical protein
VDVVKLPVDLACWLIKLVEDPQGTVEATLAKIKALPAYVKHAPAAFKEHINAIQAIEDPYEQGKAVGELMGQVLLALLVKLPASWAGGGRCRSRRKGRNVLGARVV